MDQENLSLLLEKLENLSKKQNAFSIEITELRGQIRSLQTGNVSLLESKPQTIPAPSPIVPKQATSFETIKEIVKENSAIDNLKATIKTDFEKFIGENLLNKIGIIITVIGVAIGAKYSIEHQLISPLTRIILGYLVGIGLLGFGIKLKAKYENYSAVLVSGAIAIMYFMTYAAYNLYALIPQTLAFVLMFFFTAFSVVAAINYNKQVIAHIGLVGAYAVPFLLSEGSGQVAVLFSYMAIINVGILFISFKKYWKPLYYVSFGLTWLIFSAWYVGKYIDKTHFSLGMLFAFIFFITFYGIFLAYKLLQKEKFEMFDVVLLILNSFIYYGLGFAMLNNYSNGENYLGLFTVANAFLHFGVSSLIYKHKLADRNLFYLIAGLVLVFITIAIPVQLDGNWVTLMWAAEAALLFWIGRTKAVPVYEKLSYPLMLLAFISIGQDWMGDYNNYGYEQKIKMITPIFNIHFLSSVLFIAAFAFINYTHQKNELTEPIFKAKDFEKMCTYIFPTILLLAVYFSIYVEISNYWTQLFTISELYKPNNKAIDFGYSGNTDLLKFKSVWLINYSLAFLGILSLVNSRFLKNKTLGMINLGLLSFCILYFLLSGLYDLSELRESHLGKNGKSLFETGIFHLLFRYISVGFLSFAFVCLYKNLKEEFMNPAWKNFKLVFELFFAGTLIWILSSELINWMDILKFSQSYKLGLSILWGVYALAAIAMGIWKDKKHLRIGAIGLFGITLLKLFFYDISHLDTIAKTIVFVTLGLLLLLISFLYNKYKNLINKNES
jgi:Predicted membrane protein (DUF2339)